MKSLLLMFLVLAATVQSRDYYYINPQVGFQPDTQSGTTNFNGINGRYSEPKMWDRRLPPKEQNFLVQHLNQPEIQTAVYKTPLHFAQPNANIYPQLVKSFTPNFGLNANSQQPFNNQTYFFNFNSNQRHGVAAVANAENHYQQFATNSHNQYKRQNAPQQQEQFVMLAQTGQQQQQQPLRNNYQPPNSNNPLNDLVNNPKYISQSEASQLFVPYEQMHGNPRLFTRIITKCDVSGQCATQFADHGGIGSSDFHHQQVLKQSKAQVRPHADKRENEFNYQFTGNALTSNLAKAQRGITIYKGTDLKNRRLFSYCEVMAPQLQH